MCLTTRRCSKFACTQLFGCTVPNFSVAPSIILFCNRSITLLTAPVHLVEIPYALKILSGVYISWISHFHGFLVFKIADAGQSSV